MLAVNRRAKQAEKHFETRVGKLDREALFVYKRWH